MRPRLILLADRLREERYRRLFGVLIVFLAIAVISFWFADNFAAAFVTGVSGFLIGFAGRRWFNDPP